MGKRVIIITVVLLLVINTAVLALLWWNKRPFQQHPPGGNAKAYLLKELALDKDQISKYNEMREIHFNSMHAINRETRQLKESLFDQVSAATLDSNKVAGLLVHIGSNEQRKDSITLYHFREVRTILNDQQKEKFDKIIKDVIRMMGRPQPPMPNGNRRPGDMRNLNGPPGDLPPGEHPPREGRPGDGPPRDDVPPPQEL